jgi:hypothetical protein
MNAAVVVVVPASSVASSSRAFTSSPGRPPYAVEGSARVRFTDRIYQTIESGTSTKTGDGTYTSWRDRRYVVIQFTVSSADGGRSQVLLACVPASSFRNSPIHSIQEPIVACAGAAGLPLETEMVERALIGINTWLSPRRQK